MAIELLKPLQVHKASDGYHSDGGGLFLCVRGSSSSWVFRYTAPNGKQRYMGLGPAYRSPIAAAAESLASARKDVAAARETRRQGKDPIEERKAAKAAAHAAALAKKAKIKAEQLTLRRFARRFHEQHIETTKSEKHAQQWINSVEQHVPAELLDAPIAAAKPLQLLDALVPVCRAVPETGSRVYQRLCTIYDAAVLEGLRPNNPAAPIRKELTRRAGRRERGQFPAMDWRKLPVFIKRLREVEGTAARCLEFLILTASRTSEALGCRWEELDSDQCLWVVPAKRMKAKEEHTVYLGKRAVEIIERQSGQHQTYVFPSTTGNGKPMSNMALTMCLRRLGHSDITVHGFRAAFSTWANEIGAAAPDVIEAALAHKEQDRIRRSYNRAAFLVQRRKLLEAWAAFLEGSDSNVIELNVRAA